MHPRLAAALLLALPAAGALAQAPVFFPPVVLLPVEDSGSLPACSGVNRDRLRYVRTPSPGSWWYCPAAGGSWVEVVGGGGTDDQTAAEVPIADAGGLYIGTDVEAALQETPPGARAPTAHAASHHSGGGDALSLGSIAGAVGAGQLDADSVGASALDAPAVEAELEAVLDLSDLQGDLPAARIPDLPPDTGPGPDCAGSLTYQDGEGGCDAYTLTGATAELATWSGAKTAGRCVETSGTGDLVIAAAACSAGGVTDHGALTGLTPDDDHPHYPLIGGRPGEALTVQGGLKIDGDTFGFGNPSLALRWGGVAKSGFYTNSGGDTWLWFSSGAAIGFSTSGHITAGSGSYPGLRATTASDTVPTVVKNSSDLDTGMGGAGDDVQAMIAGSVPMVKAVQNDASADIVTIRDALLITPQASAPTCGASQEGMLYYDTSKALCLCDGSAWAVVTGAGSCV